MTKPQLEPQELNVPDTLQAIAQALLNVPTLASQNSDRLDFHDLSVGAIRDALDAALRVGYATAQAGRSLPLHQPAYADEPSTGIDRLSPLLIQLGFDPTPLVEQGFPTDRAHYKTQKQAGTLKRRPRP